jgi:plastocyanin
MHKTWLIALALGLAFFSACGGSTGGNGGGNAAATIHLGFGKFIDTSASISAGQAVAFDDSQGGPHNLVVGTHGSPQTEAGAPSQLTGNGIMFSGGEVTDVTFSTPGTYMITCTIHPSMAATITVT